MSVTLAIGVNSARQADAGSVLAAAQRGDATAQAELFDRHRQRVARQILRMTGDAASLDDLVQEVFIAVFTALPGFRRDAQFETWLYTIAANKVRNWWDARRRRTAREQQVAHVPVDAPTTPEEGFESRERLARFYDALGRLPDKFREAFSARAIEHMSLQDASTTLGVPVSTVSYRTRRAEEMLCEMLDLPLPPGRGAEVAE